jgi:hypothetical protein
MKKFRSVTIPEKTFQMIRGLTNRITSVPLSTSKVVSIIAKDYITKHEKSQHNESTPTPKKELQR